jgi:zinc transporter ZupT
MKKKIILKILAGLSILAALATVITYFVLRTDRPWMAFYFACCGGIIVVNLLITLFLVNKNFK